MSAYADGDRVLIGSAPLRLRVSARSRRISLRIDIVRREAVAVAPTARGLARAVAFARERRAWLEARLADAPAAILLDPGDRLDLFGEPTLLRADGRRPRLLARSAGEQAVLAGCGLGAVDRQLVVRAIRRAAQERFALWAGGHCRRLGVETPPVRIGDARSRWGSCTPARPGRPAAIRLSWRLALAPPATADYVVAHECAHLLEPNHGTGFWRLVGNLVGNPAGHRAWLRAHGAALHAL